MVHKSNNEKRAKFGTLLGYGPGQVAVYSSDYDSALPEELPNRQAYRSEVDGVFMGYKWQCVELARRWLYINKGYVFSDIAMAYDIFHLKTVQNTKSQALLPLHSFKNGSLRQPEVGCLLIWSEGGQFKITGHVAVVTEVYQDKIRIIEQNVEDSIWPQGQHFSRELKAQIDEDGGYWIECNEYDAKILGWVIQTSDAAHAEEISPPSPLLFNLQAREVKHKGQADHGWLNMANADENAYVKMMGGHKLVSQPDDQYRYLVMSKTAENELRRATNELHAMFMHATNFVLKDDALLEKFCIPKQLWPKIRQSWSNRRNEMITGRFDFAMSDKGLKVYEYNCDSASCYMECGKVQHKWAEHFQCHDGQGTGQQLFEHLVEAWKDKCLEGPIHILYDNEPEELYHALYMKKAMEEAGLDAKMCLGFESFKQGDCGQIFDRDGERVKQVWKTWAWETALEQIRQGTEQISNAQTQSVQLADILLHSDIVVYEPLWSVIPSNKAILPILWMLYPNHPYLLESHFQLNSDLKKSGYVVKPIVGRRGANIALYDSNHQLLAQTKGRFKDREVIYQSLFTLPLVDGKRVQLNTFSVDGFYSGTCTRVDASLIFSEEIDILPLRVVEDEDL